MIKLFSSGGPLVVIVGFVVCLSGLQACRKSECIDSQGLSPSIRLASTTSTDNSGLFGHLLPLFEERTGIRVEVIAVGTGRALRLAENGDVDVVLVHAPQAEESFIAAGHGVNRRPVLHSEFAIVGPASDPAGIRGVSSASRALAMIHDARAVFVSRGDDSGTHAKELELWASAGLAPQTGENYIESGQGMTPTLRIASEMGAYSLTDDASFWAGSGRLELQIMVQSDPELFNPYHVMAVNPSRYSEVRYLEAMLFIAWLTSNEGGEAIRSFAVDGRHFFTPAAMSGHADGNNR